MQLTMQANIIHVKCMQSHTSQTNSTQKDNPPKYLTIHLLMESHNTSSKFQSKLFFQIHVDYTQVKTFGFKIC